MDKSRKTKHQLLVELQIMRRRLQEAEAALRDYRKDQPAGEGAIRDEAAGGQPAVEESGLHGLEDQSQHLLAQLKAQAEELQAANQELAIQAEELRKQNKALQALNVRLAVQKEELERITVELEAERTLLKTVLEQMPGGIIIAAAPSGKCLLVNRQMAKILGHPVSQEDSLETYSHDRAFHPDGSPLKPGEYPLARAISVGQVVTEEEISFIREDGAFRTFQVSAAPVQDRLGRMIAGVGTYHDITERRAAEKALGDSEARYRRLVDLAPDAILVHQDGKYVLANQAGIRLFGASSLDELVGKSVLELVHPDYREISSERIKMAQSGRVTELRESKVLRLDGQPVDVEVTGVGINYGGQPAIQIMMRDITGHKRAEAALRESQQNLNRAQAVAHTGSWRLDTRRNELIWSDETYRIFGISPGSPLTYERFLAAVHPEDREYIDRKWRAAMQGEPYDIEHRIVVGDTVKWVRERAEPEFDSQGDLCGGFGTVQDITGRKRADEAVVRAKEEWERTFNAVPDLIAIIDKSHRIVRVNRAMAAVLGMEPEELVGRSCPQIMHGSSKPPRFCPHSRLLADGQEHTAEVHELGRDLLVSATPLTDRQGNLMGGVHVARDLTARKQAEMALHRSNQRLDLLAETAGLLLASASPQQVVDDLCHKVMKFLDCEAFFNFLADEEAGRLRLNAYAGIPAAEAKKIEWLDYGVAVCGSAARQGCRIVTENIQTTPDPRTELVKPYGIQAYACHPLIIQGRVLGTLSFGTRKRSRFSEDDLALMKTVADQVAIAMDRKLAQEALKRAHDELEQRVKERTAELRKQAELLELAQEAIIVRDLDSRVTFWNRGAAEKYGWTKEQALGQVTHALLKTRLPTSQEEVDRELLQTGQWQGELVHARADGEEIVVASRQALQRDDQGNPAAILEINRDVTARRRAEEQVASIGRMYRMLSKVNEAIVRGTGKDELFRQICRIAVEEGLFRMAWIGMVDQGQGVVKSVARYGLDEGYLEKIKIPIQEGAESRGPTGTAAREGRYDVCNHIADDPRMAPWRQRALERGYRSSGAFPLKIGSQVVGIITMYAGEPGFFVAEEIGLLESLAQDVSFALESMETETQRRLAEEALKESEQKLRYLATQLIDSQEAERRRVSLELHDDLGQSLMVLTMKLRAIAKIVPPDQGKIKGYCDEALNYVNEIIENIRRLARDLRPSVLEDLGLPAALRHLAKTYDTYHSIEVVLDMDDIAGLFGPKEEINVYRIFQESLTNIAKYAQASRVSFIIKKANGRVAFRVEDNGRGFNVDQILAREADRSGLGLAAMEERVRMLGGSLEISSQEGRGTSIAFVVPVPEGYKPLA